MEKSTSNHKDIAENNQQIILFNPTINPIHNYRLNWQQFQWQLHQHHRDFMAAITDEMRFNVRELLTGQNPRFDPSPDCLHRPAVLGECDRKAIKAIESSIMSAKYAEERGD